MPGVAAEADGVTVALEKARTACAALDEDDPKRDKMQRFLDDAAKRLQGPPPIMKPTLPEQRRDFIGQDERDSRRPARTTAFDALQAVLVAWPKPAAVSNADRQFLYRKRRKQAHAAEAGSSSSAALEAPIEQSSAQTHDVDMPLAIGALRQ